MQATWEATVEAYDEYLQSRSQQGEVARRTRENYVRGLRRFGKWRDQTGEPTLDEMFDYLTDRAGEGLAPATLNLDKAALRKWLVTEGRLDDASRLREWYGENFRATSNTRRDYLEGDELEAMYDAAEEVSTRAAAVVRLLGDTGARVGELHLLDVEDVDEGGPDGRPRVRIPRLKRRTPADDRPVSTRAVSVETGRALSAYLSEWSEFARTDHPPAASDPLFVSYAGRLSKNSLRNDVSAVAEATDHPDVTADRVSPHLFRHTVGFRLAAEGYTATQIGDYLGKESPAEVYVETGAETVENMADDLVGD